jgi:hypothetical protein
LIEFDAANSKQLLADFLKKTGIKSNDYIYGQNYVGSQPFISKTNSIVFIAKQKYLQITVLIFKINVFFLNYQPYF